MTVFILVLTLSVIGTACVAIGCLICLTLQTKKLSATTHQPQIGGNSSYPTFPLTPSAITVPNPPSSTEEAPATIHLSSNVNNNIAPPKSAIIDLPPSYEQAISTNSS